METKQYTCEYMEEKLKTHLEATHVAIDDMSDNCGLKFNALIVSPKFDGIPLIQRHRMVNELFAEEMKTIHAFTMKTLTPQQYINIKDKSQ